jgi:hypothetical protein
LFENFAGHTARLPERISGVDGRVCAVGLI